MDKTKARVVDIETYPNCFLFAAVRADGKQKVVFEVSHRKNEIDRIIKCCDHMKEKEEYMVTFNGIGFDYPVLHGILTKPYPKDGTKLAAHIYELAQEQIDSFKDSMFGHTIKADEVQVKQMDLYRIWHFNNKAKATSLKLLQFNMRLKSIQELPFAVGTHLTDDQIDFLKEYNLHDIDSTLAFFEASQSQIDFRLDLSAKYGKDWVNCDDTKIGAEYFMMKLQDEGVELYDYDPRGRRSMRQTKRSMIRLQDCIFDYYDFKRPEFIAVYEWFKKQNLVETKGAFTDIPEHRLGDMVHYCEFETKRIRFKGGKPSDADIAAFKKEFPLGWVETEELKATEWLFDAEGNHVLEPVLNEFGFVDPTKKPKKVRVHKKSYWQCYRYVTCPNVVVDGLRIDFGVGGIHASRQNIIVKATSKWALTDADVSSMYPNLSITNNVYPKHLGQQFCVIYKDMYEQRKTFPKGSAENGMLKLALNGTYGKSNDKFSPFYDPQFTMTITCNGQLSLLLLADKLMTIEGLRLVQLNTDGVTCSYPRSAREQYDSICKQWEKQVGLQLEFAEYSKMFIHSVNHYIAVYEE